MQFFDILNCYEFYSSTLYIQVTKNIKNIDTLLVYQKTMTYNQSFKYDTIFLVYSNFR